jgi:hypothetical protein
VLDRSTRLVLRGPPRGGSVRRSIGWSGPSAWLSLRWRCLGRGSWRDCP